MSNRVGMYLIALIGFSGLAWATISNEDLCHDGLCVKVYDNAKIKAIDRLVYSNADDEILYVLRFNDKRNLLLVRLSAARRFNCSTMAINDERLDQGASRGFRECLDVAEGSSRRVDIIVKYPRGGSTEFIRKTNPTLWIDCDRSAAGCDTMTSAPLQLKSLILKEKASE